MIFGNAFPIIQRKPDNQNKRISKSRERGSPNSVAKVDISQRTISNCTRKSSRDTLVIDAQKEMTQTRRNEYRSEEKMMTTDCAKWTNGRDFAPYDIAWSNTKQGFYDTYRSQRHAMVSIVEGQGIETVNITVHHTVSGSMSKVLFRARSRRMLHT